MLWAAAIRINNRRWYGRKANIRIDESKQLNMHFKFCSDYSAQICWRRPSAYYYVCVKRQHGLSAYFTTNSSLCTMHMNTSRSARLLCIRSLRVRYMWHCNRTIRATQFLWYLCSKRCGWSWWDSCEVSSFFPPEARMLHSLSFPLDLIHGQRLRAHLSFSYLVLIRSAKWANKYRSICFFR